jgi:hypothetical protein
MTDVSVKGEVSFVYGATVVVDFKPIWEYMGPLLRVPSSCAIIPAEPKHHSAAHVMSTAPERSLARAVVTRLFEIAFRLLRSRLQSRSHYLLVMLCAVVGMFALLLSAVSPADDVVQQEFVKQQKYSLRVAKLVRIPSLRGERLKVNTRPSPPSPLLLPVHPWVTMIEALQVMRGWALSASTGERPPPFSRI